VRSWTLERLIQTLRPGSKHLKRSSARPSWHKGRNWEILYRWGASNPERLARYAEELVQSATDVMLVHGAIALIPLRKTNTTITIVFTSVSDPVSQGFVASLAHPGGNITGVSNYDPNIG
jgi:putative tryptophan/tyrosine transport system substrate-binding protein